MNQHNTCGCGSYVFFLQKALISHCKNKLVVSTTEWLPWLQTSLRDSGYQRFSLVWKSNCIRQPKHRRWKVLTIGGSTDDVVCVSTHALGGSGGMPPRKKN